jgi:hypothetical protein
MILTTKQAMSQQVIQKHYQPMWKSYKFSADGCGDNLYRTAGLALKAYNFYKLTGVVMTQGQIDTEHA